MRWIVRIAAGAAVLLVLAAAAVFLLLPRLLDAESLRGRIEQAARDSLGRELRYETLELGFLPPSVRVEGTVISGATPKDPALLEARVIALRIAFWPLLFQRVLIHSLVVEDATVRLVRTKDGIVLPRPEPEGRATASGARGSDADAGAADDAEGSSGARFAVRKVALRNTTLLLDDRAVRPAVSWEIREIEADASGRSLSGPIDLDLDGRVAAGGRVRVSGTTATDGALDLALRLDGVALAPLGPYLEGDWEELRGNVTGTATLAGPAAALDRLDADLEGRDLRVRRGDVTLTGPATARVVLERPGGAAEGRFDVDVTGAQLAMGGGFAKPAGTAGRVTGRIAPAAGGGLAFEDVKLVIRNFEAQGRVSSLDPLRAELVAEPFEVEGWEALLPALAGLSPQGRIALPELRYTAAPQRLQGTLRLDDVALRGKDAPPVVLAGLLRADGDRVASESLVARTADQTLDLDARLERLFTTPRYQLDVKAQQADSNALLSGLLSKPDTLYGPLGVDASFRGDVANAVDSLAGRVDFGVENGRLVGVSLLRSVFERFGGLGNLALDLGRAFGGRDLQRFYGDEFQLFTGKLDLAGGVARTNDLRLVYRGYTVTLRGSLGLADLALDMAGDLTIGPELDAELAQELSLSDDYQPRERVLPLASVGGTLSAPRVRLADGAAARLASQYAQARLGNRLGRQADEEVGEGTGILVERGLEVLQGVLGGRRSEPAPPPSEGP